MKKISRAIEMAIIELEALYKRHGIKTSNVLEELKKAEDKLSEVEHDRDQYAIGLQLGVLMGYYVRITQTDPPNDKILDWLQSDINHLEGELVVNDAIGLINKSINSAKTDDKQSEQ